MKEDKYKVIRRFLYGKDAIKEGYNRELLVLAAYKGDITWDWTLSTLEAAIAYLKCQHKYDPYYQNDRDKFFNLI